MISTAYVVIWLRSFEDVAQAVCTDVAQAHKLYVRRVHHRVIQVVTIPDKTSGANKRADLVDGTAEPWADSDRYRKWNLFLTLNRM